MDSHQERLCGKYMRSVDVDANVYNEFFMERLHKIAIKFFDLKRYKNFTTYFHKTRYLSTLRKSELIEILSILHSVRKIQEFYRKCYVRQRVCPITLEPIAHHPYFTKIVDPNQHHSIIYNLDALREYILVSGDFRDPISKQPYTDAELIRLDQLGDTTNNIEQSVMYAKQYRMNEYRKKKVFEEECDIGRNFVFHFCRKLEDSLSNYWTFWDKHNSDYIERRYFNALLLYLEQLRSTAYEVFYQTLKSICFRLNKFQLSASVFDDVLDYMLRVQYLTSKREYFSALLERANTSPITEPIFS